MTDYVKPLSNTITIGNSSPNSVFSAKCVRLNNTTANSTTITVKDSTTKALINLNTLGGSGYSNTDYILVSNAVINAVATLTTNATGGFQNNTITVTNYGSFLTTQSNTDVVISVRAANGAASNGSGATLTANLGLTFLGTFYLNLNSVVFLQKRPTDVIMSSNTSGIFGVSVAF